MPELVPAFLAVEAAGGGCLLFRAEPSQQVGGVLPSLVSASATPLRADDGERRLPFLVPDVELRAAVGEKLHDAVHPLRGSDVQRGVAGRAVHGVDVGAELD